MSSRADVEKNTQLSMHKCTALLLPALVLCSLYTAWSLYGLPEVLEQLLITSTQPHPNEPHSPPHAQELLLTGSTPELGSWDASKGLRLEWGEGHVWHTLQPIPLQLSTRFKVWLWTVAAALLYATVYTQPMHALSATVLEALPSCTRSIM